MARGWFVAGGLAVALIAGSLLYANGYLSDNDDISIELPLPNLDARKITEPIPGTD